MSSNLNNKAYNELRRALNFDKFIEYLNNNKDKEFYSNDCVSCPVASYISELNLHYANVFSVTAVEIKYNGNRSIKTPDLFSSFIRKFDTCGYMLHILFGRRVFSYDSVIQITNDVLGELK